MKHRILFAVALVGIGLLVFLGVAVEKTRRDYETSRSAAVTNVIEVTNVVGTIRSSDSAVCFKMGVVAGYQMARRGATNQSEVEELADIVLESRITALKVWSADHPLPADYK